MEQFKNQESIVWSAISNPKSGVNLVWAMFQKIPHDLKYLICEVKTGVSGLSVTTRNVVRG